MVLFHIQTINLLNKVWMEDVGFVKVWFSTQTTICFVILIVMLEDLFGTTFQINRERKHEIVDVNMTFQGVVSVVKTVPHWISVICVDGCSIGSYHGRGVMLAVIITTPHMKSFTMCVWTGIDEDVISWEFSLENLQQASIRFCAELGLNKLIFMNNRHQGLVEWIPTHSPHSHQLLCVLHHIMNLKLACGKQQHLPWKTGGGEDWGGIFTITWKPVWWMSCWSSSHLDRRTLCLLSHWTITLEEIWGIEKEFVRSWK